MGAYRLHHDRNGGKGVAGYLSAMSYMNAWLKTHVAEVSPVAHAIYMAGGDNYQLARNREGLVLMVRAIREGYRVLQALDVPITPASHKIFTWIPETILIAILRRVLNTKTAEIEMAGHANAARDEMQQIADEFRALARTASVPTPAIDRLYTYIEPVVTPVLTTETGNPILKSVLEV